MVHILAALAALTAPAFAEEPLVCDPREQPEVCQLKVQRNEALDAQAIAVGKTKRAEALAITLAEFWKKYVEGVEIQKEQTAEKAENKAARAAEAAKGRGR